MKIWGPFSSIILLPVFFNSPHVPRIKFWFFKEKFSKILQFLAKIRHFWPFFAIFTDFQCFWAEKCYSSEMYRICRFFMGIVGLSISFNSTPNFSEWILGREKMLLHILIMRQGKELITLRQNEVTIVVTDGPCTVQCWDRPTTSKWQKVRVFKNDHNPLHCFFRRLLRIRKHFKFKLLIYIDSIWKFWNFWKKQFQKWRI